MIVLAKLRPSVKTHFCPRCGYNQTADEDVVIGDLRIGITSGCFWKERRIRLEPMGLYTLHAIAAARGKTVRHEALKNRNDSCSKEHLKVIVSNIKKRIRQIDPAFNHIQNDWGIGYRWGVPQ